MITMKTKPCRKINFGEQTGDDIRKINAKYKV
jgi:hypothetical protein